MSDCWAAVDADKIGAGVECVDEVVGGLDDAVELERGADGADAVHSYVGGGKVAAEHVNMDTLLMIDIDLGFRGSESE